LKGKLFINARLVDPASGLDEHGGLLVQGKKIADLGPNLHSSVPTGVKVIDCRGNVLCPGLVDAMVFTGEPGDEHRETLATASKAAAAGGITTMICMPDTNPVIDDVSLVDFIARRARRKAKINVLPMAAATRSLAGKQMSEIGLLQDAGAVAFTNGVSSIANAQVMRHLLAYTRDFAALLVHNTEDADLAGRGVMNEGEMASRLGLQGIPSTAETVMLGRDIHLVELTGGRYHAAQISCAGSLQLIRGAKKSGLPVTCGVSINHLTLNENDIGSYRTFYKMKPPLRSEVDRMAMVEGLQDGSIDIIVSAHNPQDDDTKRHPFAEAEYGAVGLETLLAAALRLYHSGDVDLLTLLRAMTSAPADMFGLKAGRLSPGSPADLIVVDPDMPWEVDTEKMLSKSKNTPFEGARMQGRVLQTLVAGKIVYEMRDVR
jgi:dihydroorotase